MAELKTKPTDDSVGEFLARITDQQRRDDCHTLLALMQHASGSEPTLWGNGVIGFGSYHYKYPTGNEGDWYLVGFSSRKNDLSIHLMAGLERYRDRLARLGKYKTGKSCLYVKRLADIDSAILSGMITDSVAFVKANMSTE